MERTCLQYLKSNREEQRLFFNKWMADVRQMKRQMNNDWMTDEWRVSDIYFSTSEWQTYDRWSDRWTTIEWQMSDEWVTFIFQQVNDRRTTDEATDEWTDETTDEWQSFTLCVQHLYFNNETTIYFNRWMSVDRSPKINDKRIIILWVI